MTERDLAAEVEALRREVEGVTSRLMLLASAIKELRVEARKLPTAPQHSPAWRHIDTILQELEEHDGQHS